MQTITHSYGGGHSSQSNIYPLAASIVNELLTTIAMDGGRRRKLLDIGCGDGSFFSYIDSLNIDCIIGTEPDNELAEQARSIYRHSVFCDKAEDIRFNRDGVFDIVTALGVVEHCE